MIAAGYTAVGEFHYVGVPEARAPLRPLRPESSSWSAARRLRTRRSRSLPPGVGAGVPRAGRILRARPSASGSPPLRPRLPGRVARGDRALRRRRRAAAASTRTSSRRRSRSASRARLPADRAPRAGLPERADDDRPCDTPAGPSSTSSAHGSTICACPTTEADLGDGFLPAERVRTRAFRSASAPTRTCASIRSRNSVEGLRDARRDGEACSRGRAVWLRSGGRRVRSASTPGPRSRSTSGIARSRRRLRARARGCHRGLRADVVLLATFATWTSRKRHSRATSSSARARCPSSSTSGRPGAARAGRLPPCSRSRSRPVTDRSSSRRWTWTRTRTSRRAIACRAFRRSRRSRTAVSSRSSSARARRSQWRPSSTSCSRRRR